MSPGYGGYGGGMGGGMGGMYGGGMGGGMYGNPMMIGGPMNYMQNSVNSVGRVAGLLQMASQGLHMCFSSFINMTSNLNMLHHEVGGILSIFAVFKFFRDLLRKLKYRILKLLGRRTSLEDAWEADQQTQYSIISIGFALFGVLWVLKKFYELLTYKPPQLPPNPQNPGTQMAQQPNMYQQPMGGMYQQPYGSGYGGMGNMHGNMGMPGYY